RVGLPLGRCARAVDAAAAARARGEGRTPAEALAGLLRRTPPTPRARPRPWWFPARELSCPSACYLEARLAGCVFGERPRAAGGTASALGGQPSGAAPHSVSAGRARGPRVQPRGAACSSSRPGSLPRGRAGSPRPSARPSAALSSRLGPDRAAVPETEWRSQVLLTVRAVEPGGAVEVSVFGQPHGQNRVKGVLRSLAAWHWERRARGEKMEQLEAFLKARAPRPQPPAHLVA
uniref:KH-like RNA-binding domain-containing protein n=1 Tax=Equus asinus asinus TaxID=83772 RepID=A0A8C4KZY8_EQUAS